MGNVFQTCGPNEALVVSGKSNFNVNNAEMKKIKNVVAMKKSIFFMFLNSAVYSSLIFCFISIKIHHS